MSVSYSCLALRIAFLKPIGSMIMWNLLIAESDAVRISRSPNPNIRPKIDCDSAASLIFSSPESRVVLLSTPWSWMTRRLVSTYSWFR